MSESFFGSSDANRAARPLRHAQSVRFDQPIVLQSGVSLADVTVVYETYGSLSPRRDNAVLICHALSGDSHVARHDKHDDPGWWDLMVGPGKCIDTRHYFVICANLLGGCRGTTGPNSPNPATGRPYGPDFPLVTVEDMVDVQHRLLAHLGIQRLAAVVGGSLGGHQALCWAVRYPQQVESCVALATSAHLTSQAVAFDVVGRNAILRDPHFAGGQYYDQPVKPDVGLALARMLAHITYLSPESMAIKFDTNRTRPRDIATAFEKRFSVGTYLAYQGDRFVERFDANSYITLTMAMDLFDLGSTREQLIERFRDTTCRWLLISYSSDWLFPSHQSQLIVDALIASGKPVCYANVHSPAGHDAFLLDDSLATYGSMVRAFLHRCDAARRDEAGTAGASQTPAEPTAGAATPREDRPTSIFDQQRLDYDRILDLIEPGASVLDLGCGTGELLRRLALRGHSRLMGVELGEQEIVATMHQGIDVVQGDLNRGLPAFGDQQFDYAVLSQTLQSIVHTEAIVDAILRVGRRAIVTFPNFAYHQLRRMLAEDGRIPGRAMGLLHYAWYNTPNRRFLSILDWQEFCQAKGIRIERELFLDTEQGVDVVEDPNLHADLAIVVISRPVG